MLIADWKVNPCLDRTREEWLALWGFVQIGGRWLHPDADKEELEKLRGIK